MCPEKLDLGKEETAAEKKEAALSALQNFAKRQGLSVESLTKEEAGAAIDKAVKEKMITPTVARQLRSVLAGGGAGPRTVKLGAVPKPAASKQKVTKV